MAECRCNEQNRFFNHYGDDFSLSITCSICSPADTVDWIAVQTAIESDDIKALDSLLSENGSFHRIGWADSSTNQESLNRDVESITAGN